MLKIIFTTENGTSIRDEDAGLKKEKIVMNRKALWTILFVCIIMSALTIINAIVTKHIILIVCAAVSLVATIIFAIALWRDSKKSLK